jgi:hypothetical protein
MPACTTTRHGWDGWTFHANGPQGRLLAVARIIGNPIRVRIHFTDPEKEDETHGPFDSIAEAEADAKASCQQVLEEAGCP